MQFSAEQDSKNADISPAQALSEQGRSAAQFTAGQAGEHAGISPAQVQPEQGHSAAQFTAGQGGEHADISAAQVLPEQAHSAAQFPTEQDSKNADISPAQVLPEQAPGVVQFTAEQSGERVDVFLARALPELTRSAVQRLLEQGNVICNGAAIRKNAKTEAGACYIVSIPEAKPVETVAQDIPLDVVFEDDDVLVVNKPKGLVVHPAAGHEDGTLVNALLHHCGDSLSGVGGEKRPGIVHRIDMDTSGLLIVAKNDFAHRVLSDQLKDHTLRRTYECIVRGGFSSDNGTVDAPIGRHPVDRKRMAVTEKNSREAVTHWEVIARYGQYTHLRCRLETGRTHQIRVHMAYIHHPIAGDPLYGVKKPELGLTSQCLHARELTFLHPRTGESVTVSCPLPEEFTRALQKLQTK